jgi:hypothetical protein
MRPRVARGLVEQQSKQRPLCLSQQEQPEQQERQQRVSCGGLHILRVPRRKCPVTTVTGPRQDGATGALAEPESIRAGRREKRSGSWAHVSLTRALSRTTRQFKKEA